MHLDATKPGQWSGKLTVRSHEPPRKEGGWGVLTFEDLFNGPDEKLYVRVLYDSKKMAWPHEKGAEAEVCIQWYESKTNAGEMFFQISAPRRGGGKGFVPKSPAEIHAPQIGQIVATGMAQGRTQAEVADWVGFYLAQVGRVGQDLPAPAKAETPTHPSLRSRTGVGGPSGPRPHGQESAAAAATEGGISTGTVEPRSVEPPAEPRPAKPAPAVAINQRAAALAGEMGFTTEALNAFKGMCAQRGLKPAATLCRFYDEGVRTQVDVCTRLSESPIVQQGKAA